MEPFVGGGAMLFHMLQTYRNISHAVINDINIELATCYRIVKSACNELIDALQTIEYQYVSLCNHDSEESERERKSTICNGVMNTIASALGYLR